jgi:putative DNA primase/helicase
LWRSTGSGKLEWRWESWPVPRPLYGLRELAERPSAKVVVCEGEKSTDTARRLLPDFVVVTSPNGSNSADKADWSPLHGRDVVIWPDADAPGQEYAHAVAEVAVGAKSEAMLSPPCDVKEGWDAANAFEDGWVPERAAKLVNDAPPANAHSSQPARLRPLKLTEFLSLEIKPREMLLDPILPEKGLVMLYAARGTGKTLVALGIGFAVASGTKFLKWTASKPRRVLLVDGEMPAATLQERLANIIASAPQVDLDSDNLKILAADLIEAGGIGNLASPDVQAELDRWLDGVDLLILDNLSSLTAVVRDNDAESWGPIQEWLLKLRRRGISVLIVHHAGKGGQQRGTSRREDVLDTSISLRRPADYSAAEGARFEVYLEKARGVLGDDAKPFDAKLEVRDDVAVWTIRELEDANRARVQPFWRTA